MKDVDALRQRLEELFGAKPPAAPLSPKLLSSEDCGSYVREKIEYAIEPGERISAYLLIPNGLTGPAPALFCHHQHDGNFVLGKSEVVGLAGHPDQGFAPELAERGYLVLAPDAIAFEERNWDGGERHVEYWELATRLVRGQTLLAKVLHDVSVGIDLLQSRPEVDPERIGFIGHSYGGRMAIWSPAFDDRIKVSVCNCGSVNYANSLDHDSGVQMEFCVQGIMEVAEIEDIVTLIEPRALLISATTDDKWCKDAQGVFDYAKPAFKAGVLELKLYEGKHSFTPEMRENAYRFLDRFLV